MECQLVGPRQQAAELTNEIERLQALLKELMRKRDHLNDFIDAHLALQPFAELRVWPVFFCYFFTRIALLSSILAHFPWEYAHFVRTVNMEGMMFPNFLLAT